MFQRADLKRIFSCNKLHDVRIPAAVKSEKWTRLAPDFAVVHLYFFMVKILRRTRGNMTLFTGNKPFYLKSTRERVRTQEISEDRGQPAERIC